MQIANCRLGTKHRLRIKTDFHLIESRRLHHKIASVCKLDEIEWFTDFYSKVLSNGADRTSQLLTAHQKCKLCSYFCAVITKQSKTIFDNLTVVKLCQWLLSSGIQPPLIRTCYYIQNRKSLQSYFTHSSRSELEAAEFAGW